MMEVVYLFCHECQLNLLETIVSGTIQCMRYTLFELDNHEVHRMKRFGLACFCLTVYRLATKRAYNNRIPVAAPDVQDSKGQRGNDIENHEDTFESKHVSSERLADSKESYSVEDESQSQNESVAADQTCASVVALPGIVTPSSSQRNESVQLFHDTLGPKETYAKEPKGINNIGNTCYMDSVLQVLGWTPELRRGLAQIKPSKSGSSLTGCLHDVLADMHDGGHNCVQDSKVRRFLDAIRKVNSQFNGFGQQDSFELFNAAISGIEEECVPDGRDRNNNDVVMRKSPVTRLFGGVFVTIYYYESCHHVERVFQRFTSICVPVPKEEHRINNSTNKLAVHANQNNQNQDKQETKHDTKGARKQKKQGKGKEDGPISNGTINTTDVKQKADDKETQIKPINSKEPETTSNTLVHNNDENLEVHANKNKQGTKNTKNKRKKKTQATKNETKKKKQDMGKADDPIIDVTLKGNINITGVKKKAGDVDLNKETQMKPNNSKQPETTSNTLVHNKCVNEEPENPENCTKGTFGESQSDKDDHNSVPEGESLKDRNHPDKNTASGNVIAKIPSDNQENVRTVTSLDSQSDQEDSKGAANEELAKGMDQADKNTTSKNDVPKDQADNQENGRKDTHVESQNDKEDSTGVPEEELVKDGDQADKITTSENVLSKVQADNLKNGRKDPHVECQNDNEDSTRVPEGELVNVGDQSDQITTSENVLSKVQADNQENSIKDTHVENQNDKEDSTGVPEEELVNDGDHTDQITTSENVLSKVQADNQANDTKDTPVERQNDKEDSTGGPEEELVKDGDQADQITTSENVLSKEEPESPENCTKSTFGESQNDNDDHSAVPEGESLKDRHHLDKNTASENEIAKVQADNQENARKVTSGDSQNNQEDTKGAPKVELAKNMDQTDKNSTPENVVPKVQADSQANGRKVTSFDSQNDKEDSKRAPKEELAKDMDQADENTTSENILSKDVGSKGHEASGIPILADTSAEEYIAQVLAVDNTLVDSIINEVVRKCLDKHRFENSKKRQKARWNLKRKIKNRAVDLVQSQKVKQLQELRNNLEKFCSPHDVASDNAVFTNHSSSLQQSETNKPQLEDTVSAQRELETRQHGTHSSDSGELRSNKLKKLHSFSKPQSETSAVQNEAHIPKNATFDQTAHKNGNDMVLQNVNSAGGDTESVKATSISAGTEGDISQIECAGEIQEDSVNRAQPIKAMPTVTEIRTLYSTPSSGNRQGILRGLDVFSGFEDFEESLLTCRKCDASGKPPGNRLTWKRTLIVSPPAILVLQINRFEEVYGWNGVELRKKNDPVSYEEHLELGSFCSTDLEIIEPSVRSVQYSLYGVVVHHGSIHGGHYIAYVKVSPRVDAVKFQDKFLKPNWSNPEKLFESFTEATNPQCENSDPPMPDIPGARCTHHDSQWFYISDSQVSRASLSGALNNSRNAYILMYERMPS